MPSRRVRAGALVRDDHRRLREVFEPGMILQKHVDFYSGAWERRA